jgi:hypothetical protein
MVWVVVLVELRNLGQDRKGARAEDTYSTAMSDGVVSQIPIELAV